MGHIKEPDGVDFVINSRQLTKDEENAISEYILDYKTKKTQNQTQTKRIARKTTTVKKAEV